MRPVVLADMVPPSHLQDGKHKEKIHVVHPWAESGVWGKMQWLPVQVLNGHSRILACRRGHEGHIQKVLGPRINDLPSGCINPIPFTMSALSQVNLALLLQNLRFPLYLPVSIS